MAAIDKAINSYLKKMHSVSGTSKGVYGEQAAFKICEQLYQKYGGILYHSFVYPTSQEKDGNIKIDAQGSLFLERLGPTTEIDILLVTMNRVFIIEVKAYKAKEITLLPNKITGCFYTEKSPIHQNEMHARHLYEAIYKTLPDGKSEYIVPICVIVDKCKLVDKRPAWQMEYIYKATLDTLPILLEQKNTPLEKIIDLRAMSKTLTDVAIKYEKKLPLRYV